MIEDNAGNYMDDVKYGNFTGLFCDSLNGISLVCSIRDVLNNHNLGLGEYL